MSQYVVALCIKLHLSIIWSSIHEKFKQHWGWVEKKSLPIKKACSFDKEFFLASQYFNE